MEMQIKKIKYPYLNIPTPEALKLEKNNTELFSLGLIVDNLEKYGIETYIEKNENKN